MPTDALPEGFFNHRVIFVFGKGGVGKTTVSMALALAAARLEKNVLLVEVGEADAIGPGFGVGTLEPSPREVSPSIAGARVDPKAVLDEYVHEVIGSIFIANRITHSHLFSHIAAATPGLKEVMTLAQIWRWEQAKISPGNPRFDLIIVDAPATGHGLSWLRVPRVLIDMIQIGPIAEQTMIVEQLLHDPQKTVMTLVTVPEELPVNEALEFSNAAREWLQIPVAVAFLNGTYPKVFTLREANQIHRLLQSHESIPRSHDNFTHHLLDTARMQLNRRSYQQTYIHRLRENFPGTLIEIPFFFTNELMIQDIASVAERLLGERVP